MKRYRVFSIAWMFLLFLVVSAETMPSKIPVVAYSDHPLIMEEYTPQEVIVRLEKMLGRKISLLRESGNGIHHNAIYIGRTGFAAGEKNFFGGFGPEEWVIYKYPDGPVIADDKPMPRIGEIYGDVR